MLHVTVVKTLAIAASFLYVAAHRPPSVTTITIPYVGEYTTTTAIYNCGVTTVVVETPLATRTCSSTIPNTSTESSTTSSSTENPTSWSTTTAVPTTSRTSSSTPTTTTTTTTTTPIPSPTPGGPCPVVKPACAAAGLNIDYYANPFTGYSRQDSLPWSYYITQKLRPLASSFTNVTFFPQDTGPPASLPKIYPSAQFPTAWYAVGWTKLTNGGIRVDANNFTLVYAGFYQAPETGTYSLCTTADNENDLFFGHGNAFSCADGATDTRVRPLVVSTGGNYVNGLKCAEVTMVEGAWYPIRSVMGDWQGPSAFNVTIKTPSETFEQRRNDFSGRAYPHDCGLFV
ncbi:hypothetical protein PWT90_03994 [Aphanocladium album]|nr:hypothetical protein PWT90_03994 [Aphanocladium album]